MRLIADEVRGSVREAMKSLRADLAAAARDEKANATTAPRSDAVRVQSREQLHRSDALVSEFRARIRSDVRTFVARGGVLTSTVVDDLERSLDDAARAVTRALSTSPTQ